MGLLNRLRNIKDLPTLPEIMVKVRRIVNYHKSDATMLSETIRQDPSLTSTILKTANSAFYNPSNKRVSSLTQAITRMGFNEILKITLSVSALEQFSNTKTIIGYKAFWRHSLAAAGLAHFIATMVKNDPQSEDKQDYFLAGLLHDIGILIYDQFFHEEFAKVIDFAIKEDQNYLYAENEISPKDNHAFIGSALLEIWKLSHPMIGAVRYHHSPEKCPQNLERIVSIIAVTEFVLCNGFIGSFEGCGFEIDMTVWEKAGISKDALNLLNSKAESELRKADLILAMSSHNNNHPEDSYHNDLESIKLRSI